MSTVFYPLTALNFLMAWLAIVMGIVLPVMPWPTKVMTRIKKVTAF